MIIGMEVYVTESVICYTMMRCKALGKASKFTAHIYDLHFYNFYGQY